MSGGGGQAGKTLKGAIQEWVGRKEMRNRGGGQGMVCGLKICWRIFTGGMIAQFRDSSPPYFSLPPPHPLAQTDKRSHPQALVLALAMRCFMAAMKLSLNVIST